MLLPATKVSIWVILSIFCALAFSGESGRYEVQKPVEYSACCAIKKCCYDFRNTLPRSLSLDYEYECQKKFPVSEHVCCRPDFFPSSLYDCCSKEPTVNTGDSDVKRSKSGPRLQQSCKQVGNSSWSSDNFLFQSPDEGLLTCIVNLRELADCEKSLHSVNNTNQIVFSSCSGHLSFKGETSVRSQNIEVEKSPSFKSSLPCVSLSPNNLDWGQNYISHPSLVLLILKNVCNESLVEVYEPFSTDSQFYPFNFSKVVLGPDEVTSISFVFLPKWLGLSSAELILQTSLGGFLVQAKGVGVDSPFRPGPLVGLGVSSGGWLSGKLPLTNPFNDTIHLEEVTALLSVTGSGGTLLADAFCRNKNLLDSSEHIFSDVRKESNANDEQLEPVVMSVRPLTNWLVNPHKTESILEVAFSPCSEGKVLGAICLQLLRPLEGQRDTIVVPFEVVFDKTAASQITAAPLSVSIEAVGSCDADVTTVSLSVRNNAPHLLKITKISDVSESMKFLKIKYMEGLLLFPGSVTQVALVSFESSVVEDFFVHMPDGNISCGLQIESNDSSISHLDVPYREILRVCSGKRALPGPTAFSSRIASFISVEESSASAKALHNVEVGEFVLINWKRQSSVGGLYVLDDHELLFPPVPLGKYFAKSITVKNPSEHPVIVQLILNLEETVVNCKQQYSHSLPPWSSKFMQHDSSGPVRYGFSVVESSVTEAFLQPHGTASLGPIWFHPSNQCEWKSSALIRNNLSGVELLLLHGFGASLSLILLEGTELVHQLHFKMDLPSQNMSNPIHVPYMSDVSSGCRKPLLKKLSALNAGDFPVKVEWIKVSGAECGLDGFLVHNCKEFVLESGESLELGISYQADFSGLVIQRDLEFKLAAGVLVVPMQANLPISMLSLCRSSFFLVRVKKCCAAMILAIVLMFLFCFILPQLILSVSGAIGMKGDKRTISMVRSEVKMSTLQRNQGNGKSLKSAQLSNLKSFQRDNGKSPRGDLKQQINMDIVDLETETTDSSDAIKESNFSLLTSKPIESTGKIEVSPHICLTVKTRKDKRRRSRKKNGATSGFMALQELSSSHSGNSTPTSPLSPITSPSPTETGSPSPGKRHHLDSSRPFNCEKTKDAQLNYLSPATGIFARVPQNYTGNLISRQQQPFHDRSKGSKPMLLPSSTFPGTGRSTPAVPQPSSSRLAISPHARAPGPKIQPHKAVQAEKTANHEDKFTYNIWGDHFCGLHLTSRQDSPTAMTWESLGGHSDSFFVRGPQQTLMTNSGLTPVSSSLEDG